MVVVKRSIAEEAKKEIKKHSNKHSIKLESSHIRVEAGQSVETKRHLRNDGVSRRSNPMSVQDVSRRGMIWRCDAQSKRVRDHVEGYETDGLQKERYQEWLQEWLHGTHWLVFMGAF